MLYRIRQTSRLLELACHRCLSWVRCYDGPTTRSLGAHGGARITKVVLSLMPLCRHTDVPDAWIFIDPPHAVNLAGIRPAGAGILLSRPGATVVATSLTSSSPLSAV